MNTNETKSSGNAVFMDTDVDMENHEFDTQVFQDIGELNKRMENIFKEGIALCCCGYFDKIMIPQFQFAGLIHDKSYQQTSTGLIHDKSHQVARDKEEKRRAKEEIVIKTLLDSRVAIEKLEDLLDVSSKNSNILTFEDENLKSGDDLITMKQFNKHLFQYESCSLISNFNRGRIASIIKKRHPEKYYNLLGINSKSQVNKLIKFYYFCSRHTNFVQCKVSFSFIVENMAIIRENIDKFK